MSGGIVVKVQRPLSGDMSSALVYDKSKERVFFVPMSEVEKYFEEGELRIFMDAYPAPDGKARLNHKLRRKDW